MKNIPDVMEDIAAWSNIVFDQTGEDGVQQQHNQHGPRQVAREDPAPNVHHWDRHEGGGGQGTNYIDVARRGIQDAAE